MKSTECVVALLLLAGLASHADDWPQWRGPDRDGISKEKGLSADWSTPPRQLWKAKLPGASYTGPAVVDDTVYTTGGGGTGKVHTGTLCALNATDGSVKWQFDYGQEWSKNYPGARSTPTVADGRVYLISGMAHAICVNAKDGQKVWDVDLVGRFKGNNIGWGMAESPLLIGKRLICHPGGPDAAVAALDVATGDTLWTTKGLSDASAYCSPALLTLNGKQQIVTHTSVDVVGIDPETGEVLWKYPFGNKVSVFPNTPVAVATDMVVVMSGYGSGTAGLRIGPTGGVTRVWLVPWPEFSAQMSGMLLLGKRLYLAANKGPLLCLDPLTGAELARVEGVGKAALIATAGGLIGYDEKGKIVFIKVDGDKPLLTGSFPVTFGKDQHVNQPVVANGVLYVRCGDVLAAYDLKGGTPSP